MYRFSQIGRVLAGVVGGVALLCGPAVEAQERTIVSNQVEVSNSEASLHLEFSDGEHLSVTFADGEVTVDGEVLGRYEAGGATDRAWRGLLADVLPLANGPLARELEGWQPDSSIPGADLDVLRALDDALARAVGGAMVDRRQERAGERMGELLGVMARSENIQGLGEALEDVDLESLDIWLREDRTVPEGTSVAGGILVVDAHLDVRGRVRGDVIVLDGALTLAENSRIEGDVRLVQSHLERHGGEVEGDVVDVVGELRREETQIRDRIREEIRRELGRARASRPSGTGDTSTVGRAVDDIFGTVFTFIVVGLLTLLASRISEDRVRVITREVGHNPARCAAVGFAGGFLALPVYILGMVALAITIVGIVLLIPWVPLFPVAVAAAAFMGYVGVSHHVGRWVLDREFPWLDWVDRDHPIHVRLTGVATLFAPFAAGAALRVLPLVGWIGGFVAALGTLAGIAATTTGLGAVIRTRGGKRPTSWAYMDDDLDDVAEWSSTVDMGDIAVEDEQVATEGAGATGGPGDEEAGAGPGQGGAGA